MRRGASDSPVGRIASSPSLDGGGFSPGTILGERYRIIGLIGRGGMGEVYRADDLKLGQPVALKFLPAKLASEPAWIERFYAEVRHARGVSHPNVCRVYDVGEIEGRHFLSMEYVDGEDLASLLAAHRAAPAGQGDRDRARDVRGSRRGARQGRAAPGPEARQRHDRRPRPREDHRLRSGRRRRRRQGRSRGLRHARLHGAGAARGQGLFGAERHLRARPRALRALHRAQGLRSGDARRVAAQAHRRAADLALDGDAGVRPGRRARHPALPREGPEGAAALGRRRRRRACPEAIRSPPRSPPARRPRPKWSPPPETGERSLHGRLVS